jgi:hypothetical protein
VGQFPRFAILPWEQDRIIASDGTAPWWAQHEESSRRGAGMKKTVRLTAVFMVSLAGMFAAPKANAATKAVIARPRVWKISFELAFGDGTPYSKRYPSLYSLPYKVNLAITRDVLNRIIPIALHECGARRCGLLYGPGGDGNAPVVPSAQLDVEGTPQQVATARDCIGFLAQQGWVLVSRPAADGEAPAIQVTARGAQLGSVAKLSAFVKALKKRAPALQGFMPVRAADRAGVRMIDTEGEWTARDVIGFDAAVATAAREGRLAVQTQRFMMRTASGTNDWKRAAGGGDYLHRFDERGQGALKQRLMRLYAPRTDAWILAAFRKYAPSRLKVSKPVAGRSTNGVSVLSKVNASNF